MVNEDPPPPPPSLTQWTDVLVRAGLMAGAIKEAHDVRNVAERLTRLAVAARDLAWEMKVEGAPIIDGLLSEAAPIAEDFQKAFERVFKDGAPRTFGGVIDGFLRDLLAQSFSQPIENGKFNFRAADASQIECFGLAIHGLIRHVKGLASVHEKQARRLRAGNRGRLPGGLSVIIEFMETRQLTPRPTAEAIVETVAAIRHGLAANGTPSTFSDSEWGPANGDRRLAVGLWEHRINQALYDRRHSKRRPQRRKKGARLRK